MNDFPVTIGAYALTCCIFTVATAIFAVWVGLKATGKRIGALREFVRGNLRKRWRL